MNAQQTTMAGGKHLTFKMGDEEYGADFARRRQPYLLY